MGNKLIINSTQIPNIILDEWLPTLTGAELCVIMVIARQTYGWHKESDGISYSQLMEKTGLSHGSIASVLKSLKNKKYIEVIKDGLGKISTYRINLTSPKIGHDQSKNWTPKIGHTKDTNTKETLTKEEKEIVKEKETSVTVVTSSTLPTYSSLEDLTELDFVDIAQKYQVPLSFVMSKYDDMVIWAGSRPGNGKLRGRNWRLTLMKFVKDDAIKIHERSKGDPTKRGMDARNL